MADPIELIVDCEMRYGGPASWAHGHIDKSLFIATVNALEHTEYESRNVEHTWITTNAIPAREYADLFFNDDECWWVCWPEFDGAFSVTLIRDH